MSNTFDYYHVHIPCKYCWHTPKDKSKTKFTTGNSFKSQVFVCMHMPKFSEAYVGVHAKVWTFVEPWITEHGGPTLVAIPYTYALLRVTSRFLS